MSTKRYTNEFKIEAVGPIGAGRLNSKVANVRSWEKADVGGAGD